MHCVGVGVWLGDYGVGVTRGMVDGFLMANGQPIDVIQGWIDQLPSVISSSVIFGVFAHNSSSDCLIIICIGMSTFAKSSPIALCFGIQISILFITCFHIV